MSSNLLEEVKLLEEIDRRRSALPHLNGLAPDYKWYKWQNDWVEAKNKINLLTKANQTGGSAANIRKDIIWATEKDLWSSLWNHRPVQFWYFYPSFSTVDREVNEKWVKLLLPKKELLSESDWEIYGWELENRNKLPYRIKYNSGISNYFFSYEMKLSNIQASSPDAIFLDEETPMDFYDELIARLRATQGYFNMLCTPTLGQDFWRRALQPESPAEEVLKHAKKIRSTLFDCMVYADGSPSRWTPERVKEAEEECSSENEYKLRILGQFVIPTGLKYPMFNKEKSVVEPLPIPSSYHKYAGLDYGSGGEEGHPSSIIFVAVNPEFTMGYVYDGWRGDGVQTTAGDLLDKYREMSADQIIIGAFYDYACRDLATIAERQNLPLAKANKAREEGDALLATLFKKEKLKIFNTIELTKLVNEIRFLKIDTDKRKAVDDMIDSTKYAINSIPWNLLSASKKHEAERPMTEVEERKERVNGSKNKSQHDMDVRSEISFWNDILDGGE